MIGIIPAAGAGQRIQPLGCSKELLPVGSRHVDGVERPRAVAEFLVERMIAAGATQICMVISAEKTDIVKYFAELTNASYANTGLASVASNLLTNSNGVLMLGELAPVLLNTLQLDNSGAWTPLAITNWGSTAYNKMFAYEAGMCSGAAPIYFPPFSPTSALLGYCADGGLFANNPSMSAITAAVQQQNALSDIYVLSFDTGTTSDGMSSQSISNWGGPLSMGPVEWLFPASLTAGDATTPKFPLLSALMDSSSAAITAQAQSLLGANYYRVTVPLATPVALDDASDAAYKTMNDAITAWQTSDNFTQAVSWLSQL